MAAGECDQGCQPDWHKDWCSIYLPVRLEQDAVKPT
jgi:hypothetical protein